MVFLRHWRRGNIGLIATLSVLDCPDPGATPAAQVSGGQIHPQQTRRHCRSSVTSAHRCPPSGSPQNRQQASPGTRDPLQDDSSELSAQAPRLQENVPLACPNCLAPQHPTTRRALQVLTWSLVWNCCALPASKKSTPVTVASFKSQSALAFLCCPDVLPCTA